MLLNENFNSFIRTVKGVCCYAAKKKIEEVLKSERAPYQSLKSGSRNFVGIVCLGRNKYVQLWGL